MGQGRHEGQLQQPSLAQRV